MTNPQSTAQEKAKELINTFMEFTPAGEELEFLYAKKCAAIHVNGIIEVLNKEIRDIDVAGNVLLDLIEKYREVLNEINNQ